MNKTSFSKAELKTSFRCGMQHMLRWIEGIKLRPTFAQASGQGASAGVKKAIELHADKKEVTVETCVVAARVAAEEAMTEDGVRDPYDCTEAQLVEQKTRAVSVAGNAAKVFAEILPASMHLISMVPEQGWKLNIPGLAELTGTFAALTDESIPLSPRYFMPKIKTDDEVQHDPLMALDAYTGRVLRESSKTYVNTYMTDIRGGSADIELVHYEDDDVERMLDRVEAHVGAIQKGVAVPATHDSWTCNKEYCGYYEDICPYGRRNRT